MKKCTRCEFDPASRGTEHCDRCRYEWVEGTRAGDLPFTFVRRTYTEGVETLGKESGSNGHTDATDAAQTAREAQDGMSGTWGNPVVSEGHTEPEAGK